MKRAALIVILLASVFVSAQDQPPTGGRPSSGHTVVATRLVTKYMALERNLFQGLQDGNNPGLEHILATDFESWAAEKLPPTPRADWIHQFSGNLKTFQIHNMAVREFGDTSVVSFLLQRSGTMNGKPMSPILFIVDVWRNDKLAVRYASAPANPAQLSSTPTGKE